MFQESYTVSSLNSIWSTFFQQTYFNVSSKYPLFGILTTLPSLLVVSMLGTHFISRNLDYSDSLIIQVMSVFLLYKTTVYCQKQLSVTLSHLMILIARQKYN